MKEIIKKVRTRKTMKMMAFALLVVVVGMNACVHAPYVLPESQRTNDPGICFERDILPIFVSSCAKSGCHDAQSRKEGYELDSYASIIKKGIVPGNVAASKIWESVAISSGEKKMPQNAPPLSATQLDLIKRWIEYGAVDGGACASTCDTANFTYSGVIAPMMQTYCVGCHNSASAAGGGLTNYNSVMNAAVNGRMIGNISHLPGYNPMPTASLQLSDCQVTQVKKWVAAGAPNN